MIHASAIVDAGAQIGEGTRVWHWTHVSAGARVGRNCSLGQNVYVANRVVIGEHGTVRIGGLAVNEIQHWEFADQRPEDERVREASYETTSVYGFGHPLYYENVIQTLRGEAEPETDGREGLRSLELLVGIYISARDGRRVTLPLDY